MKFKISNLLGLGLLRYIEENIIVLAKTYPELSSKYGTIVCVAGINESGEWRRLYPIPVTLFMKKYGGPRFRKWDIISVNIKKRPRHKDYRVESYQVVNPEYIYVTATIESWKARKKIIEDFLDENLCKINGKERSLGIIKPYHILDFFKKDRSRIQDKVRLEVLRSMKTSLLDFIPLEAAKKFKKGFIPEEIPWIGYKYWCSPNCKEKNPNGHEMMCVDWEIQELYKRFGFVKTKEKALNWMVARREFYFCVGTTLKYGAWLIISLLYPTKIPQKGGTLTPYISEELTIPPDDLSPE